MLVQSVSAFFSAAKAAQSLTPRQATNASPAAFADTVRISVAARQALAASDAVSSAAADPSVETRLAEIRAKGPVNRTQEEQEYLFAHDKRLAEIVAQGKPPEQLSADDLDYMQKATGMVNTFANLSPAEKALYDKAVASGNTEAAAGISQIAFVRMMGHTAGGAEGTTYDPLGTEITPANIERYFSHSIVDPTGQAQSKFQALVQFLKDNPTA